MGKGIAVCHSHIHLRPHTLLPMLVLPLVSSSIPGIPKAKQNPLGTTQTRWNSSLAPAFDHKLFSFSTVAVPEKGWCRGYCSTSKISMSLRTGIVGLPNVGKSTLFNALVENGKAQAANFPFCTIEPNVGVVAVPDPRLNVLSQLSKSQRTIPASMEFVDIAGLVKGASQGEGLGNKFLSHIREVDSIAQVVRCFEDNDIVHVNGKIDPKSDIEIINLELAFCDLDQIEKRMERLKKGKAKDSQAKVKEEMEMATLKQIHEALMAGKPARSVTLSDHEKAAVRHLCLLTMKPVIYAANVAESDLVEPTNNPHVQKVVEIASNLNSEVVTVSAQVESELTELQPEERLEYLKSLGVAEGGLGSLIRATYNLLGLRTYFTSGDKETKAWTILAGMTAPQAAGIIHSDFEKGFIRAETVSYDDFASAGSLAAAREKGLVLKHGAGVEFIPPHLMGLYPTLMFINTIHPTICKCYKLCTSYFLRYKSVFHCSNVINICKSILT